MMPINHPYRLIITLLVLLTGLFQVLPAVTLNTQDGLTLQYSDVSGRLTGLSIDGVSLPLLNNIPGGFSLTEGTAITSTTMIFNQPFETATPRLEECIWQYLDHYGGVLFLAQYRGSG